MWNALYRSLKHQSCHTNITWAQVYLNFPKINPNLHRHNSVRVDPYAHPQHIKVLKDFFYISYGCEMISTGGWSLNHDITTSLRLRSAPISQKSTPILHRHSVRMYPYAHSKHIKVLKHFLYIQYRCGMHSMGGLSLNHDITTSLKLRSTPIST